MIKIPDQWKLNLPVLPTQDDADRLTLPEIIAICEKMLPIWNAERFKKPAPPIPTEPFSLADKPATPEHPSKRTPRE
ncbi:MAG: hypothetical protein QY326_09665 [Bdellovibrionota bacterium]|nr:MAG: hypothetical protein QY326_09665 [Bdellovibrionota bacterium]